MLLQDLKRKAERSKERWKETEKILKNYLKQKKEKRMKDKERKQEKIFSFAKLLPCKLNVDFRVFPLLE